MSNDLSANIRRGENDRWLHERQRRAQAVRDRLAEQMIVVPRPHVWYGPQGVAMNQADADYLREAARNIEHSQCLGSNLTATVRALLHAAARAIEEGPEPTDSPAQDHTDGTE